MKIGILGSGVVAKTLADGFIRHGHQPMLGTRSPDKLADWASTRPEASVGSMADAAAFGDLIVLAVKGAAAEAVVSAVGRDHLSGKTVIDTTNPIAAAPPVNGVLRYFTGANESLMERLQRAVPEAHFVKAFNSVGSARMVHPQFDGGRPTMFICGDDDGARATVTDLLDRFGWETADLGKVDAARAIEPLAILWCIPGFLRNEWQHAFKLLH